jgi:hypothetical protein
MRLGAAKHGKAARTFAVESPRPLIQQDQTERTEMKEFLC